ncbi:MAG: hypothetical protein ACTSR8_07845 [Promethearchaeota archaeon]
MRFFYNFKDLIKFIGLYIIGFIIGIFIAQALIPVIAPEAYNEVFLDFSLSDEGRTRNYISMQDNFAFTFAIIPVLLYIILLKKIFIMQK